MGNKNCFPGMLIPYALYSVEGTEGHSCNITHDVMEHSECRKNRFTRLRLIGLRCHSVFLCCKNTVFVSFYALWLSCVSEIYLVLLPLINQNVYYYLPFCMLMWVDSLSARFPAYINYTPNKIIRPRHNMETPSSYLCFCGWNPWVTGGFPLQSLIQIFSFMSR